MLWLNTAIPAQNRRIQFKGKILDKETRVAIKGANVTISGTKRGTSSNVNGEFSITIYKIPVYMTISHVGYVTQRIWFDNTSPFINVLLNPARDP